MKRSRKPSPRRSLHPLDPRVAAYLAGYREALRELGDQESELVDSFLASQRAKRDGRQADSQTS